MLCGMTKPRIVWSVLSFCLLAVGVSPALATVNFDDLVLNNYDPIPAGYGSTPTIAVSYRTLNADLSVQSERLEFWNDDYADLHKVAYADDNGHIAEMTFTATGGMDLVRLNSFQMAGYPHTNLTADVLRVLDGSGNVLADWAPMVVSGSTADTFSPDVAAPQLVIRWGYNWNIGIDNIDVTSEMAGIPAVPAPAALPLLGFGLAGLTMLRKRFAQ